MQIVIDIPDTVWDKAKEYGHLDICGIELSEKVMNGIPLQNSIADEIRAKSKDDFIALCADESSSENPNKWIPVSERLPEDGRYLVTTGDAIDRPMVAIRCFNKDLSMVDDYEFEDKKGISGWTEYDSEYGWYIDYKVIAWMPLPESYKPESEEQE